MKRFLVTYLAPASVIDDWKKTEPEQRKAAEEKMQGEWRYLSGEHTFPNAASYARLSALTIDWSRCDGPEMREERGPGTSAVGGIDQAVAR